MSKKPTYEELEQRVKELEKESIERKQMEETLRESEGKYRSMLDSIGDAYVETDLSGTFTYLNKAASKFLAYSEEEFVGMNYKECASPENVKEIFEIYNKVYRTGEPAKSVEFELTAKDGTAKTVEATAELRRDKLGKPIGFKILTRDITERRRAEEALKRTNHELKESEQRYRTLVDNIDLGINLMDSDHNILMGNAASSRILNKPVNKFIGKKCYREFEKRDAVCPHCPGVRTMATGQPAEVETVGVRDDRGLFHVRLQTFPVFGQDGKVTAFIEIAEDITERKQMEEALRQAEERYRTLVETMKVGLSGIDQNGGCTYANDQFCDMLGYSMEEIIGHRSVEFMDEENLRALEEVLVNRRKGMRDPFPYEITWTRKDGRKVHTIVSPTPSFDADGHYTGSVAIITDITNLKRTKEALQRQNDYLDALQETSLGMINRLDLNELLKVIIARAGSLVGVPHGIILLLEPGERELKKKVGIGIHRHHVKLRIKPDEGVAGRVLQTGQPLVVNDYHCWPGRVQDARMDAPKSFVGVPLKSADQVVGVIGLSSTEEEKFGDAEVKVLSRFADLASIALDNARLYTNVQRELAERKRVEEEVKEANRRLIREMREREEFLRIVSHDLGAPVRNISGMAASIIRRYGQGMDDDVKDRLARVQRNAEHELGLIGDLLELSRIKTRRGQFEEVDLCALVRGVGDGLSNQLEEKGIRFKIAENLPTVFCERNRMVQVFQNLIDNACKYMDGNKNPRIEVGFEELEDSYRFSVSDNGIGIREEDRERIFYVFNRVRNPVTSQVEGKGVGLSAVKAIVEAYGGEVWVESPPKGTPKGKGAKGSRFYFTLAKEALGRETRDEGRSEHSVG